MTDQLPFQSFVRRLGDAISRASNQPGSLGEAEFQSLALELFRLQYENVAPYRSLCERRRKTPATVETWADIPAVSTTAFKEFELTSLPSSARNHVFHSSGTTEQRPSRHFHSVDSLAVYEASLLPWFRKFALAGCTTVSASSGGSAGRCLPSYRFITLTPPPSCCPHSSLIHMFEVVQKSSGSGEPEFFGRLARDKSWEIDFIGVFSALENACAAGQPVILLGTAFLFVHLIDEWEAKGMKVSLPPGSRLVETGGYKGRSRELPKAELHRLLGRHLGLPDTAILCEYGMSELSSQAYDRVYGSTNRRRFQFPPWARVAIVSPETGSEAGIGETGLVRIHDLANVWSVAAIQTEDLAIRHEDGFELLGRAALAEPRGCSLMAR